MHGGYSIRFDLILYLYYSLVRYSAYIKLLTDCKYDDYNIKHVRNAIAVAAGVYVVKCKRYITIEKTYREKERTIGVQWNGDKLNQTELNS